MNGIRVSASSIGAAVAIAISGVVSPHATAQSAADRSADALDEVIVTARRRSENLRDVPISITAISSEEIAQRGSVRIRDLAEAVPNLVFFGVEDSSVSLLTVRGIQSQSRVNVGFDSGVSVYVDGVVQGRSIGFNQELLDIEQVEFLRGPQGTLFGKNSIAGAINVTTRRPSETFTGEVALEAGDYGLLSGNVFVSGPLSDRVAFSASAFKRQRDGYVLNVFSGKSVDDEDAIGARAKLQFKASDTLEFLLAADFVNDNAIASSSQSVSGYGVTAGEYRTNVDVPTLASRDLGSGSLTINWDVAGGTLTSISSYAKMARDRQNDTDVGPLSVVFSNLTNDQDQIQQELRFASSGEGPISYVAGLFYFKQEVDSFSQSCFGPIAGVPAFLRNVCGDTSGTIETTSKAAFFNADWRATDTLTVTVGGRYTEEEKDLDYLQNGFPFGVAPTIPRQKDSISDSDVSPTLGARWAVTPDANLYLTASRGFKSGGWNLDNITSNSIRSFSQVRFDAESAWSYELGAKSTWLDKRLSLNASLYRLEYDDLQAVQLVQVLGGGGAVVAVVSNAATARSQGAEVEMSWRPVPNLLLALGAGYADATYSDYVDRTAGGAALDFTGNRLDNAPEWTGNASVQYSLPIGNLVWRVRGDWSARSDSFFSRENLPTQRLGGYAIANLRLGVGSADERWEVVAFADNVTDKRYRVAFGGGGFAFPGVGTSRTELHGVPRQIGVRANYRF